MVNQKDIAKKLQMTQQAVSAALMDATSQRGRSKVSPETRELVINTAREMGYYSNRYASALKYGKTSLIGVAHGLVTPDWLTKIRALCSAIEKSGHTPWVLDCTHFVGGLAKVVEQMISSKVRGVVIASVGPSQIDCTPLEKANIPFVSFGCNPISGAPLIGPDKAEGFEQLYEHLYQQGCRKMTVCWGISKDQIDFAHRATPATAIRVLEAFNAKKGISFDTPMTLLPKAMHQSDEYLVGYRLGIEALKCKPDAMIFTNDTRAIGGMRACAEAGLKIPRDICVTGFNNENQSAFSLVPLTTVEQPVQTMTEQAVARLISQIECGKMSGDQESLYPCHLVVRNSSLFGKDPC